MQEPDETAATLISVLFIGILTYLLHQLFKLNLDILAIIVSLISLGFSVLKLNVKKLIEFINGHSNFLSKNFIKAGSIKAILLNLSPFMLSNLTIVFMAWVYQEGKNIDFIQKYGAYNEVLPFVMLFVWLTLYVSFGFKFGKNGLFPGAIVSTILGILVIGILSSFDDFYGPLWYAIYTFLIAIVFISSILILIGWLANSLYLLVKDRHLLSR